MKDIRKSIISSCVSFMPVFLLFMAVGTVFGIGGTSVISRALGEGKSDHAKKVCSFCMWGSVIGGVVFSVLFLAFMDQFWLLSAQAPPLQVLQKPI